MQRKTRTMPEKTIATKRQVIARSPVQKALRITFQKLNRFRLRPTSFRRNLTRLSLPTKKTKRKWAPLVASLPARTQLNAEAFTTVLITGLRDLFTRKI